MKIETTNKNGRTVLAHRYADYPSAVAAVEYESKRLAELRAEELNASGVACYASRLSTESQFVIAIEHRKLTGKG